jgi:FKBP-type peptidyl-prolyl cis-trans isomerase (trigger factor)
LLGKKIGDSVSIEYKKVQMMNGFTYTDDTDHTPTDIMLEVIDTKKKVLPELNQEFIDKVFTKDDNISSVEVLMSKIKETLSLNKENNALSQWIGEYLEAVDNSFTIMIPQTLIDEEMKNRLQHLSQQLG